MKKKLALLGSALFLGVSILGSGIVTYANNWHDRPINMDYYEDGSDIYTEVEKKDDTSAAYISLYNSSTTVGLNVAVLGTNSGINRYDYCSNVVYVPRGTHTYISNHVRPRYAFTFLALGSGREKMVHIRGAWSPDNYSKKQ